MFGTVHLGHDFQHILILLIGYGSLIKKMFVSVFHLLSMIYIKTQIKRCRCLFDYVQADVPTFTEVNIAHECAYIELYCYT